MTSKALKPRTAELRRGWRLIAGSTLGHATGVHSLVFYSSGLFIAALHADLGWSRSALSLGPTILVAALGAASPLAGALSDRHGEARVMFPGFAVLALLLGGMAAFADRLPLYYLILAAMAILAAGTATPTYTRIISRNFDKMRGTALGLTITGTAITSTLVPPTLQHIIDAYGWRSGYLALAAIVVLVAPIIYFLLRERRVGTAARVVEVPFRYGVLLADPVFRCLALALFSSSLAAAGLLVHFVPMLTDEGVAPARAASYAGLIGVTLLGSRLATGFLVDRFFAPRVATIIMAVSAAGFFLFAMTGPSLVIVGAIATGLCFGAESDLMGYLAGRYFRIAIFGRVFGVLYPIYLSGVAVSPILYGVAADYFGSYDAIICASSALLAVSAVLFSRLPSFTEGDAPGKE